ncbi:hypothetical protein SUGI_0665220 [Cryptomeria japonica]|nr:hypothetical protein SUGI_0665220 [Cryptomeria japonica]
MKDEHFMVAKQVKQSDMYSVRYDSKFFVCSHSLLQEDMVSPLPKNHLKAHIIHLDDIMEHTLDGSAISAMTTYVDEDMGDVDLIGSLIIHGVLEESIGNEIQSFHIDDPCVEYAATPLQGFLMETFALVWLTCEAMEFQLEYNPSVGYGSKHNDIGVPALVYGALLHPLMGDGCSTSWYRDFLQNSGRTAAVREFGGELRHLIIVGGWIGALSFNVFVNTICICTGLVCSCVVAVLFYISNLGRAAIPFLAPIMDVLHIHG